MRGDIFVISPRGQSAGADYNEKPGCPPPKPYCAFSYNEKFDGYKFLLCV